MGKQFLWWTFLSLGLVGAAQAQMSLQRYYIESVGFEYVSQSENAKRCVQWRDLVDKSPTLEYENGEPYVMLELEARVEGQCPLKFANGRSLDFVAGQGAVKIFRFRVTPPSTAFVVSGPGFTDQLIFEALVSRPTESSYFKFFEGSQTRFDLGYGIFKTNNAGVAENLRSTGMLPVVSGLITVPLPWSPRLQVGFSLSQNLSNFVAKEEVALQFSEFALDTRYLIGGPRHTFSLVGEVRGRNWYQLKEPKGFVVRSSPGFGLGLDYDGWVGDSKWGYSLTSRYGFRATADASSRGEIRAGGSIHYKMAPKWAIGVGYRWTSLAVDFRQSATQSAYGQLDEQSQIFNLTLHLLPTISGGTRK